MALDDRIEKAVLYEKFAALKALRQLFANGLFGHARAGKSDLRSGFGDVQIAQHGETGGYPAGGGVGHDADIGQARFMEPHQSRRYFGKLHEADGSFLHAGAAGSRDDDQRQFLLERAFDRPRDLLPHYGAQAATDKFQLQRADMYGASI